MTAHNKNNFDTDTEIKLWRPQRQPNSKIRTKKLGGPEIKKLRPETQNPKTGGAQKPKKKGQKPDKRQIMGKKHTKTRTKNTPPNTKKRTPEKAPILRPAGFAGRFIFRRRTSWRFAAKICQKKFRRFAAKYFFGAPRVG